MNISKTHNIITLSDKDEINDIIKKGQKVYTKFGLLFLYKGDNELLKKVGILIKKRTGNAVKRNYIKRIIRQFVRNEYNFLYSYSKIIFLYNYQDKTSYDELRNIYINDLKKHESNSSYNN